MPKLIPCDYMPTIYMKVFFGMEKAARYMAKRHGNVPPMREGAEADTTMDGTGRVVIRFKNADGMKEGNLYALMAHEAVHAAQEWLNIMGETKAGDEEMAYMVQCVYMCIFKEWEKHKKRQKDNA